MDNEIEQKYLSVSELNNYIKDLFDNTKTLRNICIHGEISNFTGKNRSGHLYFSIKDESCSIRVVMFKYDSFSLEFEPKDGDDVIVTGSVSSYPPNGTYQLIAKKMGLFGAGAILLKKEQLKKKLNNLGYFEESHKKELPKYPNKIAIISGKNSAAVVDIVTNINRRFPLVNIVVFYSLVQGLEASKDIIKSLHKAIEAKPDLIIIGRGGGSKEDLSAFDDEDLVKELYNCKIPIISAVGHEINRSFCDLVADKYVSTPTGAAEMAVPNKDDLIDSLLQNKHYLISIINANINSLSNHLLKIKTNKYIINISFSYDKALQVIQQYKQRLKNIENNYITNLDNKLKLYEKTISAYNPNNLLAKGYSIVYKDNEIITNSKDLKTNDQIRIVFHDGEVSAKIKE